VEIPPPPPHPATVMQSERKSENTKSGCLPKLLSVITSKASQSVEISFVEDSPQDFFISTKQGLFALRADRLVAGRHAAGDRPRMSRFFVGAHMRARRGDTTFS
jgi:hypothetical protein